MQLQTSISPINSQALPLRNAPTEAEKCTQTIIIKPIPDKPIQPLNYTRSGGNFFCMNTSL